MDTFRVLGSPSKETPGHVIGYYDTITRARHAKAAYKNMWTVVWIQIQMENGEFCNYTR